MALSEKLAGAVWLQRPAWYAGRTLPCECNAALSAHETRHQMKPHCCARTTPSQPHLALAGGRRGRLPGNDLHPPQQVCRQHLHHLLLCWPSLEFVQPHPLHLNPEGHPHDLPHHKGRGSHRRRLRQPPGPQACCAGPCRAQGLLRLQLCLGAGPQPLRVVAAEAGPRRLLQEPAAAILGAGTATGQQEVRRYARKPLLLLHSPLLLLLGCSQVPWPAGPCRTLLRTGRLRLPCRCCCLS